MLEMDLDGAHPQPEIQPLYHRVACWVGFHDYELIEVQLSFVPGSCVEKVECKHCHSVIIRATS